VKVVNYGDKPVPPPLLSNTTHIISCCAPAKAYLCNAVAVSELGDRLSYEYFLENLCVPYIFSKCAVKNG
jgi:hypothetical protein